MLHLRLLASTFPPSVIPVTSPLPLWNTGNCDVIYPTYCVAMAALKPMALWVNTVLDSSVKTLMGDSNICSVLD